MTVCCSQQQCDESVHSFAQFVTVSWSRAARSELLRRSAIFWGAEFVYLNPPLSIPSDSYHPLQGNYKLSLRGASWLKPSHKSLS